MSARIAHINLAPGYRGGERQTELLIRYLADNGWPQILVARDGDALAERCADIPGLDVNGVSGGLLSAARAFDDADLVHVHQGRAAKAAWLQSWLGGKPYIVTRRVQKGPRHNVINRSVYRRADRVIAVSAAIEKSLHTLDAGLTVQVIPDASSALTADKGSAELIRKEADCELLVGHVGALVDSHKGQLQIIDIAKRFLSVNPSVKFILVGGGSDEAVLKEAAASLPNILFAGHVDNVGDYLNAMDVFLYPSRHEGLGSVLLDAMEFGLPIVATRVGGIPEVVQDGVNGYLFAPDDTGSMFRALQRLSEDSQLREAMALVNKREAEKYSPERMGKRYELIYQNVLG